MNRAYYVAILYNGSCARLQITPPSNCDTDALLILQDNITSKIILLCEQSHMGRSPVIRQDHQCVLPNTEATTATCRKRIRILPQVDGR